MNKLQIGLIFIVIVTLACAQEKTVVNHQNSYELVVKDLTNPWGFAFLPNGSILITEKEGKLIHFRNGKSISISGLPSIFVRGQGGFMDIILDPNYTTNGWIYFSYASSKGETDGGNTTIARAKLSGSKLTDLQELYKAYPNSKKGQHFGSRLAFDNNGEDEDDVGLLYLIGLEYRTKLNPVDPVEVSFGSAFIFDNQEK